MLKCVHYSCQFPNCDRTCDLIPLDSRNDLDYAPLINMLQKTIATQHSKMFELQSSIISLRNTILDFPLRTVISLINENPYNDTCVNSPYYQKIHNFDLWVATGMPTECPISNSCKDCSHYQKGE